MTRVEDWAREHGRHPEGEFAIKVHTVRPFRSSISGAHRMAVVVYRAVQAISKMIGSYCVSIEVTIDRQATADGSVEITIL